MEYEKILSDYNNIIYWRVGTLEPTCQCLSLIHICADRSLDQFYNHDDEKAKEKDRTYSEFPDAAVFTKLDVKEDGGSLIVTANYKLGNLDKRCV